MDEDQSGLARLPSYVATGDGVFGDSSVHLNVLDNDEDFIDVPDDETDMPDEKEDAKTGVEALGSKKLTSDVWLSFEVVVLNGVKKAKCKSCKKYLSYDGKNGTSHLRKHARNTCPLRHVTNDVSQTKLRVKTKSDGTNTLELKEKYKEFDQNFSRSKLVTMIVLHEYPLSMVDHFGFRDFITSVNPSFKMISRNTLRSDILKMYQDDKLSLKQLLEHNDSKVAVTADMWTASTQKKGYMAVTSHFLDPNWAMRNRTLRFCFVPCPHTKGVMAKVLMDCLSQYCLESKISSIVIDNCTTNDAMMKILLKNFEKKCLILKGRFLHLRCSAHILNLIVKDGLDVIEQGILKVRDCVSFWMSTPKRIEKFEDSCRILGNDTPKRLVLDCKTRWNSTYYMLKSALPYKDIFERLKRLNKRMKFDIPSDEDWRFASLICEKLKIFEKATKVFSGRNHPTYNLFFRKACEIKLALMRWLEDDVDIIKSMAKNMIEKFDKYWEHINVVLAIAAILDPRDKMDCVEYYFRRLYGDDSEKEVENVRNTLDDLVLEYEHKNVNNKDQEEIPNGKGKGKRMHLGSYDGDEEDEYAQMKKTKKRKVNIKGEVDSYLEDETENENKRFDILSWWRTDRRYPTLRKIAKDILAITVSSVASESAFSMGGRVVSAHRSRLHANTVEVLMCLQNWKMEDIKGDLEGIGTCSTVNEDSDIEGDVIDIIDMDFDDIPDEDMEEDI